MRTKIDGVRIIEIEPLEDSRGFFARVGCEREFAKEGISANMVQSSIAFTRMKGTVRGLHFQAEPHWEEKIVRCTSGSAFVVVVDLRRQSSTYCQWTHVELNAENRRQAYVPIGCAQGYQTLTDNTEIVYQMSKHYCPDAATGVRFDDPAFAVRWPLPTTCLSERDKSWARHKV